MNFENPTKWKINCGNSMAKLIERQWGAPFFGSFQIQHFQVKVNEDIAIFFRGCVKYSQLGGWVLIVVIPVKGLYIYRIAMITMIQGTIGCTPNSVPMVFIVFSRDSWGL